MKSTRLLIALLLFLFAAQAPAAEKASPDAAKAVQTFYDYHFKHSMAFDAAQIKARKAWLAPELYALITKVLNTPVPEGDAPDIEGDIFTDSQEVPTAFHVGKTTVDNATAKVAKVAKVEVTLTWSREKRHFTVLLTQVKQAWLIQDIDYGDHRSLTKDLRAAAH